MWGVEEERIQDKQQKKGACIMDVQDEYGEGGSLEVTMQN